MHGSKNKGEARRQRHEAREARAEAPAKRAKEAEDEARAVAAQQVAQQLHLERENMFKKQAP